MTLDYALPLWRPPSEGDNLIIHASHGCSYNRCSFCAMYRDKQFQIRPLDAVVADIEQAAREWPDATRVFLADGDALSLPTDHLMVLLQTLAAALPRLTRVSCYATPANILRKSSDELARLRHHKLTRLYLGIESGADRILRKVRKGATQRGIGETLHKSHAAGLKVSATVILGLGGTSHWQEHIDGTLALLNTAPLNQLSTLQLHLHDTIRDEFLQHYGEPFTMPDDSAILHEQQRLIAGLAPPRPLLFRSDHISNALPLAGTLPHDRQRLLEEIAQALQGRRPLRPLHRRGM